MWIKTIWFDFYVLSQFPMQRHRNVKRRIFSVSNPYIKVPISTSIIVSVYLSLKETKATSAIQLQFYETLALIRRSNVWFFHRFKMATICMILLFTWYMMRDIHCSHNYWMIYHRFRVTAPNSYFGYIILPSRSLSSTPCICLQIMWAF